MPDVEVREQQRLLKHRPDRPPLRWCAQQAVTIEADVAGVGVDESANHRQRGALAAPGRAEQRGQRAGGHLEMQTVHRRRRPELFPQSDQLDAGAGHRRANPMLPAELDDTVRATTVSRTSGGTIISTASAAAAVVSDDPIAANSSRGSVLT